MFLMCPPKSNPTVLYVLNILGTTPSAWCIPRGLDFHCTLDMFLPFDLCTV